MTHHKAVVVGIQWYCVLHLIAAHYVKSSLPNIEITRHQDSHYNVPGTESRKDNPKP